MNINDFVYKGKTSLKNFKTDLDLGNKEELKSELQQNVDKISELQIKLYAESKQSILIVFQGMDAAGKDSSIKALFTGINPEGVQITSFKRPSTEEYAHNFLWRHILKMPASGFIGVFNRSYYENVLVTKVHPEIIVANENLPNINTINDINENFFEKRYEEINNFEKMTVNNGTRIIKFMLNVSREEQHKRFLERLQDPQKNWKFEAADFKESDLWEKYMDAFDTMLEKTSTEYAPWYVIPCDNKSTTHVVMSEILLKVISEMNPKFPELSEETKKMNEEILKKMNS